MSDKWRVVIVDDHPLFREGVARSIDESEQFEVVGEGDCADRAVELVESLMPDIVCLDISMPGGGIEAARKIGVAFPAVNIVMLTVSEVDDDVGMALEAGASGYVLKGVSASQLIEALSGVAGGKSYISPELAARLLSSMRVAKPENDHPIDSLTHREVQILELVATGMSNKEVGSELNLQEKTVKHYMTNILQKLHVRNRVEAAIIAREKGLNTKKKS